MRQLNANEVVEISGGDYFSSMLGAFGNGMSDSNKAFLVTGLGVGFAVGGFIGRWSLALGLVAIGGYAAWDWFGASSSSEE